MSYTKLHWSATHSNQSDQTQVIQLSLIVNQGLTHFSKCTGHKHPLELNWTLKYTILCKVLCYCEGKTLCKFHLIIIIMLISTQWNPGPKNPAEVLLIWVGGSGGGGVLGQGFLQTEICWKKFLKKKQVVLQ